MRKLKIVLIGAGSAEFGQHSIVDLMASKELREFACSEMNPSAGCPIEPSEILLDFDVNDDGEIEIAEMILNTSTEEKEDVILF